MTFEEALERNVTVTHEDITEEEKEKILDNLARIAARVIQGRERETA